MDYEVCLCCYARPVVFKTPSIFLPHWARSSALTAAWLLVHWSALLAGNVAISWDANKETDLAGYRVHYGETSRQYNLGVIDVGRVVQYVFADLVANQTYYFTVTAYDSAGNESAYSLEVFIKVPPSDKTPPTVQQVRAVNPNTVLVVFDEAVAQASSENKANYSIDQQISIASATLQADSQTVKLATSTQSTDKSYNLTVRNIADRATPANVMASVTVAYQLASTDTTPPTVVSATALNENEVVVVFDERVSKNSAEIIANYSIAPALTISRAALQADSQSVKLTTSAQSAGKTYNLTIRNIADRATPANVMASAVTVSYQLASTDTTPPAVVSATALNENEVAVVFDEQVSKNSAETIANYNIAPALTISRATLQADNQTVKLATSTQSAGKSYSLTVRNIADRATPANVMASAVTVAYQLASTDTTPPAVVSATALNESEVAVVFDQRVTKSSAETISNYSISPALSISRATLQEDESHVLLQTGPHNDGQAYELRVQHLADMASPPNVMPAPVTLHYTYRADDHEPPQILAVTLADLTTLLVSFNEKVTIASAENLNNYLLSDDIRILSARLNDEGLELRLQTSLHNYNQDYTLTVSGITDASSYANTLATRLVFTYRLERSGDKENGALAVSAWSPASYQLDSLRAGTPYYIDRANTITNVPSNLARALLLRTAYRDRRNPSEIFLEFNLNRAVEVYVAYEGRVTEVPQWLKFNFIETSQKIVLSTPGEYMKLWRARHLPGRVQLGGNLAEGVQYPAAIAPNMYFVLISAEAAAPGQAPGSNAPPKAFEISQNFPNPFRLRGVAPHTVVECYLKEENRVVVTIYNTLGQVIRILHDGVLAAGSHRMTWDGRDENHESVPSGKYLYAMEIREEMQQGPFVLTSALTRETKVMTILK